MLQMDGEKLLTRKGSAVLRGNVLFWQRIFNVPGRVGVKQGGFQFRATTFHNAVN